MMIKYENLNLIMRRVVILVAIAALTLASLLNAFGIEPFEVENFMLEQEKIEKDRNEKEYNEARDRIDEGTATDKDYQTTYEFVSEHFAGTNQEGGRINNNQDS